MTKRRFTPAYPAELRERGFGCFERTVPITPVIPQRIGQLRQNWVVRLTACVPGVSKPNAMLASEPG